VYSLGEATCEAWLAAAGVTPGASATLYWTVVPTTDNPAVQTEVRSLTAVRKDPVIIALNSPADEVTLNANTVTFPYQFSWTTVPEVTAYTIKFAPSAAALASTAITADAGNDGVYSLGEATCEAWLAGAGIEPGASATLYWTVVPTTDNPDVQVQTEVRSFTAVRYDPYTKLNISGYTYNYSRREEEGDHTSDWSNMANLLDGNYTTSWTSWLTSAYNWVVYDQFSFTVPSQTIDRIKIYRPAGNTDPMTVTVQIATGSHVSARYGFDGNAATFQTGEDVVTIDVPEGTTNTNLLVLFIMVEIPSNGPMTLSEIECYQKK
jgi:hypothetical protein